MHRSSLNVLSPTTSRDRLPSEDGSQWLVVADAVAQIGLQSALNAAPAMADEAKDTSPSSVQRERSKSSLWFILDDDDEDEDEDDSELHCEPAPAADLQEEKPATLSVAEPVAAVHELDHIKDEGRDFGSESPVATKRRKVREPTAAPAALVSVEQAPVPKRTERKRKARRRPPSRICKFEGCEQYVVDQGLCVRHGGGKRCEAEGCSSRAKHQGKCWKHGGSTACKVASCPNRAKSRGYCWSHGGGTKCKTSSCEKIAISNGLCWAHGGGKRCIVAGCKRQAYERTQNYCNTHYTELFLEPTDDAPDKRESNAKDLNAEAGRKRRLPKPKTSLKRSTGR